MPYNKRFYWLLLAVLTRCIGRSIAHGRDVTDVELRAILGERPLAEKAKPRHDVARAGVA